MAFETRFRGRDRILRGGGPHGPRRRRILSGAERHASARRGRHRPAAMDGRGGRAGAGDRDDELRRDSERRAVHETRRPRLRGQAGESRRTAEKDTRGAGRSGGAGPGGQTGSACGERGFGRGAQLHRGAQRRRAAAVRTHPAGGPDQYVGAGERRERHGQGTRGAADPPGEQTGRKTLRGGRLRGRSPRAGGIGVLRACQGVVHRGPRRQDRRFRGGRRRHALSRRGGQPHL